MEIFKSADYPAKKVNESSSSSIIVQSVCLLLGGPWSIEMIIQEYLKCDRFF